MIDHTNGFTADKLQLLFSIMMMILIVIKSNIFEYQLIKKSQHHGKEASGASNPS